MKDLVGKKIQIWRESKKKNQNIHKKIYNILLKTKIT